MKQKLVMVSTKSPYKIDIKSSLIVVYKYVQKDERLPLIVHEIRKSAQTTKCLIVTKLKNENCAHCDQGSKKKKRKEEKKSEKKKGVQLQYLILWIMYF